MTNKIVLFSLFIALSLSSYTQSDTQSKDRPIEFKAGFRFQKTQKLYWENGLTVDFTAKKLWDKRIHFGLSYVSSRLGSAINSNAIKQDNFLFSTSLHFMHKKQFQPLVRVNLGYFYADYEEQIFDVLQNTAFLFSLEGAVTYEFKFPFVLSLGTGINLNTGNGMDGAGTLFPIYYQLSITYTFLK
jgi:hypothetical protein